jgi:CPA2 family monovalent cation:H+ antiporter-2
MDPAIATTAPPAFLSEVVALVAACAFVAYVCHRFGIMPIVSFLLTGALVGPHALRLVRDEALIEAAAELGVILLLFMIGIEFSLAKLARIKRIIFLGGGLQVGLVVALVTGLLALFGVDWRTGVFTGFLVALSSTAIVMKLLMDAGDVSSQEGQAALGILIFQDLAVVAMVLLIPILGGTGVSGWGIVLALGKAAGIVALVLLVARRIMPRVLEAVARTCSQEIFLLSVVGICLGTAFLTSLAGVSLSLGAFLAGLIVSESRFSQMAFGEILPLQILFSATFFVSVGLLLDLSFLVQYPLLVLTVIAAVLAIKFLTTGIGLRVLGYGTGAAACTGLALAQVGEFSFVLERAGRALGLHPAGFEAGGPEAFIGATVTLMIATPFLYRMGESLRRRGAPRRDELVVTEPEQAKRAARPGLRDHVIIAGFGEVGRRLAPVLEDQQIPYVIGTLSPEGAREAERGELQVQRGNYTRQHELTLLGLRAARLLVVADDDFETTRRVVSAARALNPDLPVFARTRLTAEVHELKEAGADEVVSDEEESLVRLLTRVLEINQIDDEEIRRHQATLRSTSGPVRPREVDMERGVAITMNARFALTEAERQSSCSHTDETNGVSPSAPGCEECLKTGDRWVHLRICMTCGHVGCCDSSPNRHATKHHRATEHPIVKSLEPGNRWAWCYVDQRLL